MWTMWEDMLHDYTENNSYKVNDNSDYTHSIIF